jgi:hypothetical protein
MCSRERFCSSVYFYSFPPSLLGDVRREFMQRFSVAIHGTLGSYLSGALHEGNVDVDVDACVYVPRA